MTSASNYLIPQVGASAVLDTSVQSLFNSHNVSFGCALTLILQPPFSNNLLTTLPEDQALAARHASIFKNGWGLGVTHTYITSLTSISVFLLTLCAGQLMVIAQKLDSLSPQDSAYAQQLSDFRQLLAAIADSCCDTDPDSGSMLLSMQQMVTNLTNLAGQIDDDDTRIHTALGEVNNSQVIINLEAQQRSLQDQLAGINQQISQGASTTIASDIAFGFAFATPFTEGGVTPGAVGGAVLSIVGEADAIKGFEEQTQHLSDEQTRVSQQIFDLANTIASDKADAMSLTLVAAQMGVFNSQIASLLGQASSILVQMSNWKNDLDLLSDYVGPPSVNFYTKQVSAGVSYWSALQTQLVRYSSIMAQSVSNPAGT
jgi:hypothetical protein